MGQQSIRLLQYMEVRSRFLQSQHCFLQTTNLSAQTCSAHIHEPRRLKLQSIDQSISRTEILNSSPSCSLSAAQNKFLADQFNEALAEHVVIMDVLKRTVCIFIRQLG